MDISKFVSGWKKSRANKSVEGNTLSIGGKKFEHGIGTHAPCVFWFQLDGWTSRFTASVGVDDEIGKNRGSVEFMVVGDGKVLWKSGVMKTGDAAKEVDVKLRGIKKAGLIVSEGPDGMNYDHADWADAQFEC